MLKSVHESTADKRRGDVADGPNDRSPKLATGQAGTARGRVVGSWAHAARIGEYLAGRDERGKCDCVFEAQDSVQARAEGKSADGTEQSFPRQGIVVQTTSSSTEFD